MWRGGINHLREYSAVTYLRLNCTLILIQLFLIAHVSVGMTQPSGMSNLATNISGGFLMAASILLTIMSIETNRRKKILLEKIEQKERDDARKT